MLSNRATELIQDLEIAPPAGADHIILSHDSFAGAVLSLELSGQRIKSVGLIRRPEAQEQLAIIMGFIKILGTNIPSFALKIKFKEIENFLRDNPLEEAWPGVFKLREFYNSFRDEFVTSFFEATFLNEKMNLYGPFNDAILSEQIDVLSITLNKLSTVSVPYDLDFDFVTLEEDTIFVHYVKDGITDLMKTVHLRSMLRYLRILLSNDQIKLVAQ
jgi:hypothetical protein